MLGTSCDPVSQLIREQAEKCLKTARDLSDREARCVLRERAAQLLKQADAASPS